MKKTLALMTLLLLPITYAEDGQNKEALKKERVAKAKSMILAHMDKRIAAIEQGKACVNSADGREAFKQCRQELKGKMQALKQEAQSARQAMKSQRK